MREFQYLTKDLPLIMKKDLTRNWYDEEMSIIEQGTSVYFANVGIEGGIIVKRNRQDTKTETLNRDDIDIDYNYVTFPFYEEDLMAYDEDNSKDIQVGMNVVTGDMQIDYDCIGAGQVVEVLKIDKDGFVVEVKDQFGNVYEEVFSVYVYDESKLNKDTSEIINPVLKVTSEIKIPKENLEIFVKALHWQLSLEHEGFLKLSDEDVMFALAEASKEYNDKMDNKDSTE
jgi:hypothetical protein